MNGRPSSQKIVIAVLADKDKNPSAAALPLVRTLESKADILLGNTLAEFTAYPNLSEAEALVWVPPGDAKILPDLWPLLPKVRWVHSWFAGLEPLHPFIKQFLLNRPDIPVTNAKGAFSRSLAEYSMAAALHFEKQVPRIMANTKSRHWDKFIMHELHGKSMGFVGFGDIGKATAKIAKHAFGMRILALRRSKNKGADDLADEVFSPEIEEEKMEVFRRSDYVVCSLPGTPDTFNFCGAKEFAAMKPTAVFISIGRGTVVDEDALIDVLKRGAIRGAALDVFHVEPLPESSGLWGLDNVLITAHNADWTPDYSECALHVMEGNLDRFLAGEKEMLTPIDKAAGY
ncbi:unnamed protein product [Vitrella brassicaformis CCMP3155]|uniref:D-isomer specific 2-hydroxyacid dehydrogenase NAD-binding domain-containing protein n=2 Tax=Vitrella brassicaformis TaxID=1169539 RepID=A0A0G4G7E5_VITBC|nr:unnamed protein product [Vitrella brassicaformis CCMP3155]|eukprot:CEM24546.1 unnamed protein product [Vitrella brassicaformis CCMP3155]